MNWKRCKVSSDLFRSTIAACVSQN